MSCNVEDFQYVLLSGQGLPQVRNLKVYDSSFEHWSRIWRRILNRKGGEGSFDVNDFFRSSLISNIVHKESGEIAAQGCASFFNLKAAITQEHPYFVNFRNYALEAIQLEQVEVLMSLEFTSVNPKFSPRRTGLALGEMIIWLESLLMMSSGADAGIGQARTLTGIQGVGFECGYRSLHQDVQKFGLEVDLFFGRASEIRAPKDPLVFNFLKKLWREKLNYTLFPLNAPSTSLFEIDGSSVAELI